MEHEKQIYTYEQAKEYERTTAFLLKPTKLSLASCDATINYYFKYFTIFSS